MPVGLDINQECQAGIGKGLENSGPGDRKVGALIYSSKDCGQGLDIERL
jgi:hypothetical protein